jgi:phosphate transport system substrate-binding protein
VRRLLLLGAAVLAVAAPLLSVQPAGADGAKISGGGSGFAALEMTQWRADAARKPYNLQVDYSPQGSSVGRANFASGLFDYGATDITFQPQSEPDVMANLKSKRCGGNEPSSACFVYVPVSAGGLGLMFNLQDNAGRQFTNLRLTRQAVCKIFTGQINMWNDSELTASSPELANFNRPIHVVTRDDGAGESYVLSEFCIAVAPAVWAKFVDTMRAHQNDVADPVAFFAGKPTSKWPNPIPDAHQIPASPADTVANTVADSKAGKDAIGYNAAGYAKVRDFPVASVENAAGQFTQPDEENVTVALAYATGRPDGTFLLSYTGADQRAYFPSTYSYVLAQTGGWDAAKGATLGQFLCYAVGKGQVIAPVLRYARLSKELVDIAVGAISKIPGAPPASECAKDAPPPPPPPKVVGGAGPAGSAGGPGSAGKGAAAGTNKGTGAGAASVTTAATTAAATQSPSDAAEQLLTAQAGSKADGLNAENVAHGMDVQQVLAAMAEGAAVCGVGLLLAGRRKRVTP